MTPEGQASDITALVNRLNDATSAVYLAAEEGPAKDLSALLYKAAAAIASLEAERDEQDRQRNEWRTNYINLLGQKEKLEAENRELRQKNRVFKEVIRAMGEADRG